MGKKKKLLAKKVEVLMKEGRQACQEKNKKIIFLQSLINIACNKYIKDSYQRTYMLNLVKVINFWLKTHNMTDTQSHDISHISKTKSSSSCLELR